ncbi:MAG TPA: hypothetical protein VHH15_21135 [Actinophytocola sp.]|nr:hypothetical protein [Actinophytocola sp.]
MSASPTFEQLLDDAALYSFEHQLHLAEVLGEHSWEADLAEPRFGFTGDHPRVCSRFHLLGSAAPGPGSWLWGWANPHGYPQPLLALGEYVRDFGRRHGIAELAEPEIPFDALPGSPSDPNLVAGMLTEAAKAAAGNWTSYSGEVGGGTRAAFLVEHPDFTLPPPAPTRVMRVLQQGLAELRLGDHRRAVHAYAVRRGLDPVHEADRLTLNAPGLSATVHFDQYGRIENINAAMGQPA